MNTEATHDQHEALSTGVRLRNAREQLGLSQQAVAERLCLKVSTVRDIEEDKAPADLASTFLRGYIRSYAKLVHIPENELLPMMEKQALGKRRKKRDGWLMSFTWLVLFVVIGLTGAWWWQNHKAQQEEITTMADQSSAELNQAGSENGQSVPLNTDGAASSSEPQTAAPDASATDAAQAPVATANTAAPQAQDQNAVVAPSQANVDTAANAPAATQPADNSAANLPTSPAGTATAADPNALVMNFSADCWLEVTDATGKKLFSGLQRKDGTLNLTGQAPYKLKIGAPAAVQIQYQGKPVDLSRFIRTNQVARLTVNAEQSAAQ